MRQLYIDSYRKAEEVPGGPDRPAWLHVNDGTRRTGASVVVSCADLEFAAVVADAIAELLPASTQAIALANGAAAAADERASKAHAGKREAEDRLDAVLHGRRRLFGEALVKVLEDGSVWLQDPEKGDAGFGLRYPSLTDLWMEHPELRPVRWQDGNLTVDATIALGDGK